MTGQSMLHSNGRARTIVIAAVVVICAAASLPVFSSAGRRNSHASLGRLAKVVGHHRTTRARISGGFLYAPCRAPIGDRLIVGLICEEPTPDTWPELAQLQALASERRSPASRVDSGAERHFIGAWQIVWHDADSAVATLASVAKVDPSNASVQSDLAAALLERAELKQDPLSIVDAYAAADSALALDPDLPEARFNRALVLEKLFLKNDAIRAWSSYLEIDSRSLWANEARVRLEELHKPEPLWSSAKIELQRALASGDDSVVLSIARQFPQRTRAEVRAAVIAWSHERLAGRAGADTLARAMSAARALRRATSDAFWSDVAEGIADAVKRGDRTHVEAIARGVAAFEQGEDEYGRSVLDSAERSLELARRSLGAGGNALAHFAAYDLAKTSYQRQNYSDAIERLRRVLASTPDNYLVLRGSATRTIGFIEAIRANFDRAMIAYTSVLRDGSSLGDPALDLRALTDGARLALTLRGERPAWDPLYRAFRSLERYAELPSDAQHVFAAAAELSVKRCSALALLFQAESVRLAWALSDSLNVMTALTRQAKLFGRTGQSAQAFQTLDSLRAYLRKLGDDSTRAEMQTNADLVLGEIELGVRPDSAVDLLKKVVKRYQNTDYGIQLAQAKVLLARAYAAGGKTASARVEFEGALSEMERQRSDIGGFEDREHFLDQARPVIDSVLRFLIEQRDTVGAIEFLERMRGRVLLERTVGKRGDRTQPTTVDGLRRTLEPGTKVVSYAVLEREIVAWLIDRDGVRMYRVPVNGGLKPLVDRFTTLITSRSSDAETEVDLRDASTQLYKILVTPFQDRLAPDSRLVVVPDKWLHFVPFAALFDAGRSRFLAQLVDINVVPSVQLFAQAAARYRDLRTTTEPSVLAVGNPAFDKRVYASLPTLPGAEREARSVARQYSHSRVLLGAGATKQALLQAAVGSNLIHFAGHGIVRPEEPLRSHLVLAPDARDESSGAIYAKDLFDMALPQTRLAILSGCHTAGGELSDTEGASSLARALFAAGVPAVIASLWAVDDDKTETFFSAFHAELRRDQNPAAALRRTQQQWLAQGTNPWRSISVWAAFQLFGATSD
jgi:CHAT domain-containing protein/tetratricopeptide (TPR) repeat protein